jgi:hypothetical protein
VKIPSRASHGPRVIGCKLLALGLLLYANLGTSLATTPIYKCFDKKFDVVYTDVPCKDGAPLDVRAGEADPVAVARLERTRDALDQSAAQRISDMRWAAAQRAFAPLYAGPSQQGWLDYSGMNSPYDYGAFWGLPGFASGRPPHARPRGAFNSRDFAFAPPNLGGRR